MSDFKEGHGATLSGFVPDLPGGWHITSAIFQRGSGSVMVFSARSVSGERAKAKVAFGSIGRRRLESEHERLSRVYDVCPGGVPRPYILHHDHDEVSGVDYCVLLSEEIEGTSLGHELLEKVTDSEMLALLKSLLKTLDAAHGVGVIHGDIRPQNVVLRRVRGMNAAVIIDWEDVSDITDANGDSRSVAYLSPQRLLEDQPPSEMDDIWAASVVALQEKIGRYPLGSALGEGVHPTREHLAELFKRASSDMFASRGLYDPGAGTKLVLEMIDGVRSSVIRGAYRSLLHAREERRPVSAAEALGLLRTDDMPSARGSGTRTLSAPEREANRLQEQTISRPRIDALTEWSNWAREYLVAGQTRDRAQVMRALGFSRSMPDVAFEGLLGLTRERAELVEFILIDWRKALRDALAGARQSVDRRHLEPLLYEALRLALKVEALRHALSYTISMSSGSPEEEIDVVISDLDGIEPFTQDKLELLRLGCLAQASSWLPGSRAADKEERADHLRGFADHILRDEALIATALGWYAESMGTRLGPEEALECYLAGTVHKPRLSGRAWSWIRVARSHLRNAPRRDARFADAWAALSQAMELSWGHSDGYEVIRSLELFCRLCKDSYMTTRAASSEG